jgi:hypothetical protein
VVGESGKHPLAMLDWTCDAESDAEVEQNADGRK